MPKPKTPTITSKDKRAPVYIKTLELEIKTLKGNLRQTQNQSSGLLQKCHDVENENSILKEKLSGSGWISTTKDVCLLLGGSAISLFADNNTFWASVLFLLSFVTLLIYIIGNNFKRKI